VEAGQTLGPTLPVISTRGLKSGLQLQVEENRAVCVCVCVCVCVVLGTWREERVLGAQNKPP
jgi:hypothetical protein